MTIVTIKMPGTTDFPIYIVLYLLFFFFIPHKLKYKNRVLQNTSYCWGIILIWGCLLAFIYGFNSNHFKNLAWTFSVLISFHVISALMLFNKRRIWIYRFFIIISFLIAVSGIYEGITGIYYHETDANYLYAQTEFGFYRPNTIFYNVNDNAIFSTLCLIISFFYPNTYKEHRIVRILSLLLFGANIIMVDSRGAELATASFLALSFIFYKFKKNARLVIILSCLIVLPFLSMILQLEFLDVGGRNAIWAMCLRSLANSNFIGVGPGEIATVNMQYNTFADVYAAHNFILEMLCDYGIIGGLVLIIWLLYLMKKAYEMFRNEIHFSMLPAIVAFLLASITCSSLIGKGFSILFFAFVVAEMNKNSIISKTKR